MDGYTNRIYPTGASYDANGNMIAGLGTMGGYYIYDIENRMVNNNVEQYGYNQANQRTWKKIDDYHAEVYFYGPRGELLDIYSAAKGGSGSWSMLRVANGDRGYFAGRMMNQGLQGTAPDRLGSLTAHYPYGEEKNPTPLEGEKFATYFSVPEPEAADAEKSGSGGCGYGRLETI